jgi:hypothetical protein
MSDPVWIAVIVGAFGSLNSYFSYRANVNSKKTLEVSQKTETNTNSIVEALVKTTGIEAHARGLKEGQAEGKEGKKHK